MRIADQLRIRIRQSYLLRYRCSHGAIRCVRMKLKGDASVSAKQRAGSSHHECQTQRNNPKKSFPVHCHRANGSMAAHFSLFISFWVGWRNLFDLLPHEIAIVFLTFITPIIFIAVIYIVLGTMAEVRQIASNFQQQGELIKALSDMRSASSSAAETKDQ